MKTVVAIILNCLLFFSTISGIALCADSELQPFDQVFQRMVEEEVELANKPIVRQWGKPHDWVKGFRPAMSRFASQAQNLIEAGASREIEFLLTKSESKDGKERCLALMTLARLAENKQAREAVAKQGSLAISFMEPQYVREVALDLANQSEYYVRFGALDLLAATGDKNTLERLQTMKTDLRDKPVTAELKERVDAAISLLEKRLSLPADQQIEWGKYLLILFRANREEPSLNGERPFSIAAEALARGGMKMPAKLLEIQIRNGDMAAITMAGMQKDDGLIGALLDTASKGRQNAAAYSVAMIDSEASYKAIADLFEREDPQHSKLMALTLRGQPSERSVALLEKLCRDERYKDSWPTFEKALRRINAERERQKAAPPAPEPQK